jgi:hypothetical protein
MEITHMFTSEEAYEAHNDGEPIMVSRAWATKIVTREAGDDATEFLASLPASVDAWVVLSWLGY